ncbi:hypothetical protein BY996DRAFT_4558099, partial [Phakopsora pachyrhizi]
TSSSTSSSNILSINRPSLQTAPSSTSLLLLSTSAEAAVIESKSKPDKLGGLLYECEKCPKVYRHPQCLIKHRWEHTTYWADASKLMLSKHQQVQMLEAAAILAAPSGSLPESRSLWPAAVSPSEAGLLGSEHVNLDVIRSQARPVAPMHHHSTSVPYENSGAGTDAEMGVDEQTDEEVEEEEEEVNEYDPSGGDEDEIMFEMSLGSDENGSTPSPPLQNLFSLGRPDPAPPSMGYFQKRVETPALSCLETASSPLIHANQARVPAMVAYKPAERPLFGLVSVYHPEIIFKPMKPYADSELRFEGKKEEEGDCKTHLKQVEMADNEDVDRGNEEACFDGFENGSDEVVGMEL